MTCQISTMDATGTIIGDRNAVRNCDASGMRLSSITARPSDSTTDSGTATADISAVFLDASRKAELRSTALKLSSHTKLAEMGLSTIE